MAAGLADNHELTLIQTAIAKSKKVIVAPAYNEFWYHPENILAINKLMSWGVQVIFPIIAPEKVTMMTPAKIMDGIVSHFMKIKFDSTRLGGEYVEKKYLDAVKTHYPTFQKIGQQQESLGTNSSKHGCYSVEVDDEWILITGSGSFLGSLKPEDLTLLHKTSENGAYRWVGNKPPSSESPLHLAVYSYNKAKAVAHSHCPSITYNHDLQYLATEEYIPYGESQTVDQIQHLLGEDQNFFILRYHGEVAYAEDLERACNLIHEHLKNE